MNTENIPNVLCAHSVFTHHKSRLFLWHISIRREWLNRGHSEHIKSVLHHHDSNSNTKYPSFNQTQISIHTATKMLESITWNNKNVPKCLIFYVWETMPYVNDGLEFIRVPFFPPIRWQYSYCASSHEGLWSALRAGSEVIGTRNGRLCEIKAFNCGVRMEVSWIIAIHVNIIRTKHKTTKIAKWLYSLHIMETYLTFATNMHYDLWNKMCKSS